jgi:hypothetical protein
LFSGCSMFKMSNSWTLSTSIYTQCIFETPFQAAACGWCPATPNRCQFAISWWPYAWHAYKLPKVYPALATLTDICQASTKAPVERHSAESNESFNIACMP